MLANTFFFIRPIVLCLSRTNITKVKALSKLDNVGKYINFVDAENIHLICNKKVMKATLVLIFCLIYRASGHARLLSPPSRATMWRFGFPNPHDYQDNEGFCGGFQVMNISIRLF